MKCPRCNNKMEHKGYDWICSECGCVQRGFDIHGNYRPYQLELIAKD